MDLDYFKQAGRNIKRSHLDEAQLQLLNLQVKNRYEAKLYVVH